jgi:guanosine-3',5'-bis(diphosphate) 3'-pyrophosphohydrolase
MEVILASIHTPDFNLDFAIQVALLHDTIEDTLTTFEELKDMFGIEVASAVSALSKNPDLPKDQQMMDSIVRIKKLPPEVWAVKMADRITNLQEPPERWSNDKKLNYRNEARLILSELGSGNDYLAKRLKKKIEEYILYF